MKHLHLIYSIILLFITFNLQAESVKEALQHNKIQVKIYGNTESTHYHTPLTLEVKNISTDFLSLDIDNGTILEANIPEFQNFIVTEHLLAKLQPNEIKQFNIRGMCIEQYEMPPNDEVLYTIGGKAPNKMQQLSLFVEKNKKFEPNAQFLMWNLAQNNYSDIENVVFEIDEYGDVLMLKEEDGEMEKLTTKEIEDPSKPQLIVNGNFTMNLASNKNVHIAMFNTNNVLVKEIYRNPNTRGGITKLEYEFNSYDFEEEEYYMKVVLDGKIILERTIDMTY